MSDVLRPAADWELQSILAGCLEKQIPIEVVGAGSKRAVGRPVDAPVTISTSSMRGIPLYEPGELVMSARAGTLVSQIEAELAARGQMLAFEPVDLGAAIGTAGAAQTIGAVFAINMSGSRRISAGSARDHLIGVKGVNGRGEVFKSGGRVLKNVTGYDIARGLTGSWGTLAILTEVTFKVLPIAEASGTVVFTGLPDDIAVELLCSAMSTPFEVSGAVHLTEGLVGRLEEPSFRDVKRSVTLLRLEASPQSVSYRAPELVKALKVYGGASIIGHTETSALWSELRRLTVFPASKQSMLWRISTAPQNAVKLVSAIRRHMPLEAMYDWSGGLIWLEAPASSDAGAADIRRAVALYGGHATLIRAEASVRKSVQVFQPQSLSVERLTRGLKKAFDPHGLLNPGRMYAEM